METAKAEETVDLDGDQDIPVPDYPDDDVEDRTDGGQNRIEPIKLAAESLDGRLTANGDDSELIMPKKLVNPCLLSKEHKALRQELKMNHKLGKNPTEKPELIKVLKERQQKEKKKEQEEHLKAKRTSFDIRLEEQASKISQAEQQGHEEAERIKEEEEKPEFFKMHSKINKAKADA